MRSARAAPRRLVAAPRKVRIVGGQFKRTPLPVADLPGLRPTPDRVRETLFNWLRSAWSWLRAARARSRWSSASRNWWRNCRHCASA